MSVLVADLEDMARRERELARTYQRMADETAWAPRKRALGRAVRDAEQRAEQYDARAERFRRGR